jgi:hypothetical protein
VSCYVDRLIDYTGRVPYRHKVWCHLVADTDEELLACGAELGVSEAWLQGSRRWDHHFDLPAAFRSRALDLGAREVDFRFMGRRTRARRAALALSGDRGSDLAVGAPVGASLEVVLPPGQWEPTRVPEGLAVSWHDGHPLLPGRPVAVLGAVSASRGEDVGPVAGVVGFGRVGSAKQIEVESMLVAVVLGAPVRPR